MEFSSNGCISSYSPSALLINAVIAVVIVVIEVTELFFCSVLRSDLEKEKRKKEVVDSCFAILCC